MSSFRKISKVASCDVTFSLLRELEDFLLNEVIKKINIREKYYEIDYSIAIEDSFGSEKLQSIKEYSSTLFSNSTYSISLSYYLRLSLLKLGENEKDYDARNKLYDELSAVCETLSIDIDFSKNQHARGVKITYDGSNAKDNVFIIDSNINNIINNYKNNNFIYNYISINLIMVGILIYLIPFSTILIVKNNIYGIALFSLSLTMLLFITLGKRTHPYFLYESKLSEKYKKFNYWAINAIFIVFINIVFLLIKTYLL